MDPARPVARSLGILHGRIIGQDEDIERLNAGEVIDLGGRTVVPGFIDAHCHTAWFGLGLIDPSVEGCTDFPELFERLRGEASAVPAGEWLVASGFNHRLFGGRFPDLAELDAVTGEVPLPPEHPTKGAGGIPALRGREDVKARTLDSRNGFRIF